MPKGGRELWLTFKEAIGYFNQALPYLPALSMRDFFLLGMKNKCVQNNNFTPLFQLSPNNALLDEKMYFVVHDMPVEVTWVKKEIFQFFFVFFEPNTTYVERQSEQ